MPYPQNIKNWNIYTNLNETINSHIGSIKNKLKDYKANEFDTFKVQTDNSLISLKSAVKFECDRIPTLSQTLSSVFNQTMTQSLITQNLQTQYDQK